MIAETSLIAFNKHKDGSFVNRSDQIYEVLSKVGARTSNEIFDLIKNTFPNDKYRHNTHARLSDLRDEGKVRVTNKRECMITGEVVYVWEIVPSGEQKQHKIEALNKKLDNAKSLQTVIEDKLKKIYEQVN